MIPFLGKDLDHILDTKSHELSKMLPAGGLRSRSAFSVHIQYLIQCTLVSYYLTGRDGDISKCALKIPLLVKMRKFTIQSSCCFLLIPTQTKEKKGIPKAKLASTIIFFQRFAILEPRSGTD